MSQTWYWARQGQQFGPLSLAELSQLAASRQLQPTDMVWTGGMAAWVPASQIEQLWPPADPRFPPPPPPHGPAPYAQTPQVVVPKVIAPSNPPRSPILMGVLSGLCIPGLGQMIIGQVLKGVIILIGSFSVVIATAGLGVFITAPLAGIDAYLVAKKLSDGRSVGEWECF